MYIQTRRRKMKFPSSSFRFNSFLFFSRHCPLNLYFQTDWKRKELTHSEDPNSEASSSSTPPHGGDYEGGDEQQKGNDCVVFLSTSQYNSLEMEEKRTHSSRRSEFSTVVVDQQEVKDYKGRDEQLKEKNCDVFLSIPQYTPLEMERKEPTHLEDSVRGASSSSTSSHIGDHERGTKKLKGNDYEVFLSFRRRDTSKGFTNYLYTSLVNAGINVFRDNNELRVGEELGSEILNSLTQSKILIPIISKNYASSKWCLRELAHIMKCKKSTGQRVLPIFYKVATWDVRYFRGDFGEAFHSRRHYMDDMEIKEFIKALQEVSSLKGWESEKIENGREVPLIKMVVEEVTNELYEPFWLTVPKESVEIDDRVEQIMNRKSRVNGHQVFLSFAKVDSGDFADYLYTSFVNAGIHVFTDENIRVGEEIDSVILNSLIQSKISIPIVSESYGANRRCLHELIQMLKCKRSKRQIVLPIFYKVHLSDVRYVKGEFGRTFYARHHRVDEMTVKESIKAFNEVCSLQGLVSEEIENGNEGELVKIVVEKVMSEFEGTFRLIVPKELVGIDDRVEQIRNSIDAKFNDTRIIGIWGMSGIGKTTLAKVLYNKLSSHFKHCSFVANIRETSRDKGIECLQKQLIDDILRRTVDVSTVNDGIGVIKSQFIRKKILILLDDVDSNTHLNALAGDISWFKAGSIVIITTRNKRILNNGVDKHELKKLSPDQSLLLFNRHAFQRDYPHNDYQIISRNVVSITMNLPLALEVIGSLLHEKGKKVWNDTLKKLKDVSDQEVQEILRISYTTLDNRKQRIFLDIACFFIGSCTQSSTYMWDACGVVPRKDIEVLSHMSLIKIDKDGKLMMHDELRDLGREIVHLENSEEPQKRSRLWIYEDAVNVLDGNKGTSKIEAIRLDKFDRRRSYTGEQFKELTNLRFLQVCGVNFIGDFQNMLPQLRWLQWEHCPSNFAAVNFHLKKLVVLNLSWSEISEDWEGWNPLKMATQLKVLNLTGCLSLRSTPNLSSFKSLDILILEECENLEMIHDSIRDINLVSLNVKRCGRLKELPTAVSKMTTLRDLLISETAIREIPISEGDLMNLNTLCASWCPRLAQLSESIGSLKSLTQLDLSHSEIEELPESMSSLVSLTQLDLSYSYIEELPHSMSSLVSLTQLDLSHSGIGEFSKSMGSLTLLTQLDLSYSGIKELTESVGSLKKLETLNVSNCASLVHIHSSIGHLTSLSLLDLRKCHKLAQLPNSIDSLVSLQRLLLRGCCSLREIPDSIRKLTSLTELDLKSTAITKLPQSIEKLQNLRILDIRQTHIKECPNAILTPIFKC